MATDIERKLGFTYSQKGDAILLKYRNGYRFFCPKSLSLLEIHKFTYAKAKEFFSNFSKEWNVKINPKSDTANTFYLTIYFSNKCNLRCKYCYIHGEFQNSEFIEETFDNSIIKNEIKKVLNQNLKFLEINFFGGEPLLYNERIFEILHYINDELSGKIKIKTGITTNGSLLTSKILKRLQSLNTDILLSLDSPPKNHDIYRADNNPKFCFERVINNIHGFENYISVVTTITQKTDSLKESLETLIEIGFKNVGFNVVYTNDCSLAIRKKDKQRFINELLDQEEWFIANSDKIINIKRIKDQIINRQLKTSPCSSGVNAYTITSTGNKYFCHSCVGDPSFEIDDISASKNIIENKLANRNENSYCKNCWGFNLCGGECWLIQLNYPKEQREFRCDIIKTLIKIALSCKY